jgi:hypothetical protein
MLYFFMQAGHMLWPYGILALQKAHAADASLFLASARVSNRYRKGRMAIKLCYLHRRYQDFWTIRCTVMTFFAAERAVLSMQKDALADVGLDIAFCRLGEFACAVAKRAVRISDLD